MLRIANKKALVVAISGGSGSGKTTIAHRLRQYMPEGVKSVVIYQDNYYKDQGNIPLSRRLNSNYDTPSAFDWDLMKKDLEALKNKRAIESPVYDFTNHTRSEQRERIDPVDVIIFEGFMSLHTKILDLSDIRIFVDTPSDERLLRRMMRDIKERKRTFESIASQWRNTVRPMYRAHVAPQKEVAHIIIPWYEISSVAIKAIKGSIMDFINAPEDTVGTYVPPVNGFEVVESEVNASVEGSAHAGEEVILLKEPSLPGKDGHGNLFAGSVPVALQGANQAAKQRQAQADRFRRMESSRQQPSSSVSSTIPSAKPVLPQARQQQNPVQRPFQQLKNQPVQRPSQPSIRTDLKNRPANPRPQFNQNRPLNPNRPPRQPNQPSRPAAPAFKGQQPYGRNGPSNQARPAQMNKSRPVSPLTSKGGSNDDNSTDRGF